MHPVLESLRSTDRQWLIDTLYAFNSGNVETFQALKSAWGQQVSELIHCLMPRLDIYRGHLGDSRFFNFRFPDYLGIILITELHLSSWLVLSENTGTAKLKKVIMVRGHLDSICLFAPLFSPR